MTPDQLDPILAWARTTLVPVLFIVVIALIAMRLASIFVRGVVTALLDREATEGTSGIDTPGRIRPPDAVGSTPSL